MDQTKQEENTRISIRISNELLADFDQYAREKGYQTRNNAIIDVIKAKLKK